MDPSSQTAAAAGTIGLVFMAGYVIFGLISFICFIKILIALFKKEGAGLGIVGIITCGIYPYIWGWIKSTELALKKTMIWWTIAILGMFAVGIVGSVMMAGVVANDPGMQKMIKDAQEQARQAQMQQADPAPAPVPAPVPQ